MTHLEPFVMESPTLDWSIEPASVTLVHLLPSRMGGSATIIRRWREPSPWTELMTEPPFLDLPPAQSVDSLPVRSATPDLLDFDRVAAHIAQAIDRGRYNGPTDPFAYLVQKRCLIAVGAEHYATLAGILCFGRAPQATFPTAV